MHFSQVLLNDAMCEKFATLAITLRKIGHVWGFDNLLYRMLEREIMSV